MMKTNLFPSSVLRVSALGILMGASAEAVLTETLRLVPKTVSAGEQAGAVATGFGRVALGSPAAVNPRTGLATGAVYLFDAKSGKELATLFPTVPEANAGMAFGEAVAISGNLLVVGAPGADSAVAATDDVGAAFVFDLRTGRLVGNPLGLGVFAGTGDRLGSAVAIDGDRVAVAARGAEGFGNNAGLATGLVLVRDLVTGGDTLVSADSGNLPGATQGVVGDEFGAAVALRGDLLVVGAPGAQVGADADAGRVYVVGLRGNGVAVAVREVVNPHVADVSLDGTGDGFGTVVALGSRHLVVGAPADAGQRGVVHVFDASRPAEMSYWNVLNGANAGERLGEAVATAGNLVVMSSGAQSVFGYLLQGPYQGSLAWGTLEAAAESYGRTLALADDLLVVGAPGWDGPAGANTGAALVHSTQPLNCPDFFPLTRTGNAAHGTSGDTYVDFTEVVCHLGANPLAYGTPLLIGRMQGQAGLGGGVWAYDPIAGTVPFLGRTNATNRVLSRPVGNRTGQWWWRSQQTGPSLPNVFSTTGSGAVAELHNGDGQLGGVNRPLKAADELRVDDAVADLAQLTLRLKLGGDVNPGNDSGIYNLAGLPAAQGFSVREGAATALANVAFGELGPRLALNSGVTSFVCALQGTGTTAQTNQGVVFNGALVARRGEVAAGVRNANGDPVTATFGTFTGVTHGPSGGCLFRASLNPVSGVTGANNEGLWSTRTGSVGLILQKGLAAPVLGGAVKVKRLLDFGLLSGGDVLVLVQVSGPGVTAGNDGVLLLSKVDVAEPGNFEVLLREGDRLPGVQGARLGSILRVEMATIAGGAPRNHYGVLGSLVNEPGRVTPADNLVWLVGDTAAPDLELATVRKALPKLRKGAASSFYGVGYERLTSVAFPAVTQDGSGARGTGMALVIDPRSGGSTGVVSFPNKRKATGLIVR